MAKGRASRTVAGRADSERRREVGKKKGTPHRLPANIALITCLEQSVCTIYTAAAQAFRRRKSTGREKNSESDYDAPRRLLVTFGPGAKPWLVPDVLHKSFWQRA